MKLTEASQKLENGLSVIGEENSVDGQTELDDEIEEEIMK